MNFDINKISSEEPAMEMLQFLLCSIIIICRFRYVQQHRDRGHDCMVV